MAIVTKTKNHSMNWLCRMSCFVLAAVLLITTFPYSVATVRAQDAVTEGKVLLELLQPTGSAYQSLMKQNQTVVMNGTSYNNGISVAPGSTGVCTLTYPVKDMEAERFYAVVGSLQTGSAWFSVSADGQELAKTELIPFGQSAVLQATIPQNAQTVTLTATAPVGSGRLLFADAGFLYTASPDCTGVVYLSDMVIDSQTTLGGVILDKNNANNGEIAIEGQTFSKGLSLHPTPTEAATVIYDIFNCGAESFTAWVGQCDTANYGGDGCPQGL